VINVALLSVIRRWHLRDGMSIREVSRRTGLSRNTVRKYLTNGVVEPKYPARTAPKKLIAFIQSLRPHKSVKSKKAEKSTAISLRGNVP